MATPFDATVPTLCDAPSGSLSSSSGLSESPDTSKRSAREKKHQRSVSDSDCQLPRKRTKESSDSELTGDSISTTSTSRSESESPLNANEIPFKTSEWTEFHLSQLNITIDGSHTSPYEVFASGYTNFLKDPDNDVCPLSELIESLYGSQYDTKVAKYQCYLHAFDILSAGDSSSFDHVEIPEYLHLKCELRKSFKQTELGKWMESFIIGKNEEMKDFITDTCRGIYVRLKDFCDQLLHIMQSGKTESTDGMYKELFLLFLRIFDIKVRGCQNFQSPSLRVKVGNLDVISIPDALMYKDAKDPSLREKVLAVVEVKKKYCSKYDNVAKRKLRITEKKTAMMDHLESNCKGRHVGEMLAALPRSAFSLKGIYGIIVQGTEVTMAALNVGEEYYENLQAGSLKRLTSVVKYSRPCNFLKKSEREDLIKLFLDMSAMMDQLA